jgi:hypothetical protein
MERAIEQFPADQVSAVGAADAVRKREKPCDVGSLDTEGRKQMELF